MPVPDLPARADLACRGRALVAAAACWGVGTVVSKRSSPTSHP